MPLSRQNRRKWLAYTATIFATGALSGALFGWGEAQRRRPSLRPMGPPPSGQHLCDHLRSGLQREFKLPPEQLQKAEPILQRRAEQLDLILNRSRSELEALTSASDNELAAALQLTPEQKARLPFLGRGGPRGPGERPGRFERREHEEREEHGERGERGERSRYPEERRLPPPR